jgi:hypothetical protein
VCLAITISLNGQEKPLVTETLTWMKDFLGQHGFMFVNSKLVRSTNIVKIEMHNYRGTRIRKCWRSERHETTH